MVIYFNKFFILNLLINYINILFKLLTKSIY